MKTSTIFYIASACVVFIVLVIVLFILRNKYIKDNYGSVEHKKNSSYNKVPRTSTLFVNVSHLSEEDQRYYNNNGLIATR